MVRMFFKKSWFHVLVWVVMVVYFVFAPDLFTFVFAKNGKPTQANGTKFAESDLITFVVDGFEPYVKDGEKLYDLYGWALLVSQDNRAMDSFIREIVLTSGESQYFFPTKSVSRNMNLSGRLSGLEVDLDTLGFSALIAGDPLKPGKYRVGIVFKDPATGSAFYWDKPASYLVKTPNTLTWKRK